MNQEIQSDAFSIPSTWRTPLNDVPEQYRASIIAYAKKIFHSIMGQEFSDRLPIEKTISAESTGLSCVLSAGYFPFHLVLECDRQEFIEILSNGGPNAGLEFIRSKNATNDVLMVIGDLPVEAHVFKHLNNILDSEPARFLVAGPGTDIENVLRNFISRRDINKSFLRTADLSGGQIWDSAPGPALEDLITRLFKEQKPTRIIAFEPVRLPSTQIAMDYARNLNLPVECIEAPTIKREALPF